MTQFKSAVLYNTNAKCEYSNLQKILKKKILKIVLLPQQIYVIR